MFGLRKLTALTPVARNVMQSRNMTVIATPARNKISRVEQTILASVMVFCWCFTPAWVLVHMKEYRGEA